MYERKVGFNFNMRIQIYKKFKMLCLMESQSMTSRINEMIEKDIERYQREKHIKL